MRRTIYLSIILFFLITILLNPNLPASAQSESILISDPDLTRFPLVQVKVNIPCRRFTSESDSLRLQLQEDGLPVRLEQTSDKPLATQTALLLDIWSGAGSKIEPIRSSLDHALRSAPGQPAMLSGSDSLLLLGPDPTGLHIMNVITETGWTNDGGLIVNNVGRAMPAQGVTALTTLISDTLMTFASVEPAPNLVKSIVAFSDGTDPIAISKQQIDNVITAAQQQGVAIHTVYMADSFQDEAYLRQFSARTGGISQTLTVSNSLESLWRSISKSGCEISYRSQQKQPQQLTLWNQQTGKQTQASVFDLPDIALPAPQIDSLQLSPDTKLTVNQSDLLTVTYTASFPEYPDRQFKRIEYGIQDRIERSIEITATTIQSVAIPIRDLSAGTYDVFLRMFDEFGLMAEKRARLEMVAAPVTTPPKRSSTTAPAQTVTATTAPPAQPTWWTRVQSWFAQSLTKILGTNWRSLLISLLIIILLIETIIALALWVRHRNWRWKREKVRIEMRSSQSLLDEQPVIAVLRRRKLVDDIPELILLRKSYTRIGRNAGALDVDLDAPAAGNDVFVIEHQDNEFRIAKDEKTNAVTVQGRLLTELGETRLDSDYLICIGQVEFIFHIIQPLMRQQSGLTNSTGER